MSAYLLEMEQTYLTNLHCMQNNLCYVLAMDENNDITDTEYFYGTDSVSYNNE